MAPFPKSGMNLVFYVLDMKLLTSRALKNHKIMLCCCTNKKGAKFTFKQHFLGVVRKNIKKMATKHWKNGAIFLSEAYRGFVGEIFEKYGSKPIKRTSNHDHTTNRKKKARFCAKKAKK